MLERIKKSRFFQLYNFHDELARGRSCMSISAVVASVIAWLTTNLFYTSFLLANGIDVVNIGILLFVPYIANCFSIFSPSILERFKKRKYILAASRTAYYTLNILAITLLPSLTSDTHARMVLLVAIIFAANIINALFTSGYSVWHVNFIPNNVRAEYFSYNSMFVAFVGCGAALVSALIADALAATPYKDQIIVIFRYFAYALGLLDVFILTRPKEFPYLQNAEKPRLKHIFTLPFQHRKFAITMGIVFFWTFFANIPQSSLSYHHLNNIGMTYTFNYIINMFYPFFLLFFLPPWKKVLNRLGWLKTFAYAALMHVPTTIMYACVTPDNYIWLFSLLRMLQHLFGVGMNVAYANIAYINLPEKSQTNYISFHILVTNVAGFLGMMAGTGFVAAYPDISIKMLSMSFSNIQLLLLAQAFGQLVVPLAVIRLLPVITPDGQ